MAQGVIIPNADAIRSFVVPCPAAQTPYRLPECSVPDDMPLVVKAYPTNVGMIFVGESASAAVNPNQSYPLLPNEAIAYRIKNANAIYISAALAGDSVVCTVEQSLGY